MDDEAWRPSVATETAVATGPTEFVAEAILASTVTHQDAVAWFDKRRGTYDRLTTAVAPYIDRDATILDIGANIGYFTKILGETLSLTGTVHLFEPVPNLAALCRITVADLPFRTVVHDYGLSDEDAEIEIFTDVNGDLGRNTIIAERAEGMTADKIRVRRFAPEELGATPSFVKIDVEGAESRVLGGMLDAIETWSQRPVILCEIGWGTGHPYWEHELEVFTRLLDLGYRAVDLDGIRLDLATLAVTTDVIFLPAATATVAPIRTTRPGKPTWVPNIYPYRDDRGNSIVYDGRQNLIECRVKFAGSNNHLVVADGAHIRDSVINFDCDNGLIQIGANHYSLPPLRAHIVVGQDGKVLLGDNVSATSPCGMSAAEGAIITVDKDVMFASGNALRADDAHPIFDVRTGKRVNISRPITIGRHVWLGKGAAVLSGVTIGQGSVIGYGSVVTKRIPNNCVAAGIPARVVRRDIAWERPHLTRDEPYYKLDASTVRKSPYWHLTVAPGATPKKPSRYTRARMWSGLVRRARRLFSKTESREE